MAHEITSSDNLFSVREHTWHGLGVHLAEYPTRAEAQAIAHPWEPVTQPIYLGEPTIDPERGPELGYRQIETHQAIQRSDNSAVLGVVTSGYTPVTNNDMWDVAEAIQGSGVDVRYETGGSLRGGSQVWLLLRLNEPLVIDGDPRGESIPYYSLQNSHDGSGAFRGQATMTRIVCANTAQIADLDARQRGTEFTFRHTKNVGDRIEQAREALTGWRSSLEAWKALSEHMLTIQMTHEDTLGFLDRWIPEPLEAEASERVRANVADARALWFGALNSVTCEGITNTAHGVMQASIEYAEHMRYARNAETRFRRTYLNRNDVVQSARKILLSV